MYYRIDRINRYLHLLSVTFHSCVSHKSTMFVYPIIYSSNLSSIILQEFHVTAQMILLKSEEEIIGETNIVD